MVCQPPSRLVNSERRRKFVFGSALALFGMVELGFCRTIAAAIKEYPKAIEALKEGVAAETAAHRRYVEFAKHAASEGYRGLAYLYTALATSERIHAQNYERVLVTLGESISEPQIATVRAGTAKENLIYAAEREWKSIESTYPRLLDFVGDEGHAEAISVIQYSWLSHKQHLDIIGKIRRWSPSFFESVARRIDEKTDRYYVCEVCGSTVTKIPVDSCPICGEHPANYRLIAHDRFL